MRSSLDPGMRTHLGIQVEALPSRFWLQPSVVRSFVMIRTVPACPEDLYLETVKPRGRQENAHQESEPLRLSRRFRLFRGWCHGKIQQVLTRGSGAGGADRLGPPVAA